MCHLSVSTLGILNNLSGQYETINSKSKSNFMNFIRNSSNFKILKKRRKEFIKKIQAFSRVSSPLRNPGLATTHRPLSFSSSRWCSILLMCSSISCRHTTKTKLISLIIGQTLNIRGFGYGCQSHKCLRYFLKCWNLTS